MLLVCVPGERAIKEAFSSCSSDEEHQNYLWHTAI